MSLDQLVELESLEPGFHKKDNAEVLETMNLDANFVTHLTNKQLLELHIVKFTVPPQVETYYRKSRRSEKEKCLADFTAPNFSITYPQLSP